MLMRSLRTHGETNDHHAPMRLRHRTWLLLSSAAAVGLLAVVLGVRVAVRWQDTVSLTAIGITPVTPPTPVPSFSFADQAGHSLSLADFQGRAVVLNLWATWCMPCRKELPSLDRLQTKLGGPRFQVLAVSIDKQGAAVVQPFYRALGLRSLAIHLAPTGKPPSLLNIEGIPATLLIDREGREIGRKLGAVEWDAPATISALRQALRPVEDTQ
jgi:thiol-disulfide isomerase/thioredoxin